MPLAVRWSEFTYENLDRVDWVYGVYELGDENKEIIYLGQGILRDRLLAHLRGDDPCTIQLAEYYRVEKTGSKIRAEQRERVELKIYLKRYGELPLCNRRMEYP